MLLPDHYYLHRVESCFTNSSPLRQWVPSPNPTLIIDLIHQWNYIYMGWGVMIAILGIHWIPNIIVTIFRMILNHGLIRISVIYTKHIKEQNCFICPSLFYKHMGFYWPIFLGFDLFSSFLLKLPSLNIKLLFCLWLCTDAMLDSQLFSMADYLQSVVNNLCVYPSTHFVQCLTVVVVHFIVGE